MQHNEDNAWAKQLQQMHSRVFVFRLPATFTKKQAKSIGLEDWTERFGGKMSSLIREANSSNNIDLPAVDDLSCACLFSKREGVYYLVTDQSKLNVNKWLNLSLRRRSVRRDSLGLHDPTNTGTLSSEASLYASDPTTSDTTSAVSGYDPSVVRSKAMASPFNPDLSLIFARSETGANGTSKKVESKSSVSKASVFHHLGPAISGICCLGWLKKASTKRRVQRSIFTKAANIFRQRRTERFFVLYHAGFLEYYTEPPPWVLPLRASVTRSYMPTGVMARRGWSNSSGSEYDDTVETQSVLMGCLRLGARTRAKLEKEVHILLTAEERSVQLEAPDPKTARLWLAALERIIQAAYHSEYTQRRERMLFSVRHLSTEPVKDYSQQGWLQVNDKRSHPWVYAVLTGTYFSFYEMNPHTGAAYDTLTAATVKPKTDSQSAQKEAPTSFKVQLVRRPKMSLQLTPWSSVQRMSLTKLQVTVGANEESNLIFAAATQQAATEWHEAFVLAIRRSCLSVAIHQEHVLDLLTLSDLEEGTPNPRASQLWSRNVYTHSMGMLLSSRLSLTKPSSGLVGVPREDLLLWLLVSCHPRVPVYAHFLTAPQSHAHAKDVAKLTLHCCRRATLLAEFIAPTQPRHWWYTGLSLRSTVNLRLSCKALYRMGQEYQLQWIFACARDHSLLSSLRMSIVGSENFSFTDFGVPRKKPSRALKPTGGGQIFYSRVPPSSFDASADTTASVLSHQFGPSLPHLCRDGLSVLTQSMAALQQVKGLMGGPPSPYTCPLEDLRLVLPARNFECTWQEVELREYQVQAVAAYRNYRPTNCIVCVCDKGSKSAFKGASDVARKRDDTHREQAAIVRMNPFNKLVYVASDGKLLELSVKRPPVTRQARSYVIVICYATHVPSRTKDGDDYFCKVQLRDLYGRSIMGDQFVKTPANCSTKGGESGSTVVWNTHLAFSITPQQDDFLYIELRNKSLGPKIGSASVSILSLLKGADRGHHLKLSTPLEQDPILMVIRLQPTANVSHSKRLFIMRHGQSTWNEARQKKGFNLSLDHPLNAVGIMQCKRLQTAWTQSQTNLAVDGKLVRPAERSFLKADALLCSPLTRAVQTALVSLRDHPVLSLPSSFGPFSGGKMILRKDLREVKKFGGLDTVGVAVGTEAILERAHKKFKESDCMGAVEAFEYCDVLCDAGDCKAEWWSARGGLDTKRDVELRYQNLFQTLHYMTPQCPILVGHSLFFNGMLRRLVRAAKESSHREAWMEDNEEFVGKLCDQKIQNAAVLCVDLVFDDLEDYNRPRLSRAEFLFGTGFKKEGEDDTHAISAPQT